MKGKSVTLDGVINKFDNKGEKTGWRYIEITHITAQQLFPGNNKSFRVSGTIDQYPIDKVAVLPMGDGKFILPLNSVMRKAIGKKEGQLITIKLKHDNGELLIDQDLLDCLEMDPVAKELFFELAPSHRNYFSKWIASAKTVATKTKRISMTLEALVRRMDFGEMLRSSKK